MERKQTTKCKDERNWVTTYNLMEHRDQGRTRRGQQKPKPEPENKKAMTAAEGNLKSQS